MQLRPAIMVQGTSQQTAMQVSTTDEGLQVVKNKGSKHAPSSTAQAAGHAPSRHPNTGPDSAAAAAAQRKLMAEAHNSLADPVSGRVRCRACGKAFSAYSFLAQHLKQRHFGLNSEDAKVLEYRHLEQQQQAGSKQSSSTMQLTAADFPSLGHTPAAAAAPPASSSAKWAGLGINTQPSAATNGPSKNGSSNSTAVVHQQEQPSTAATMSHSSSTGRAAGKPRPLAAHSLDLGHLMELSSKKQQQQRSPQQHKRRSDRQQQQDKKQRLTAEQVRLILAAAAEQGLRVKHGAAELKRNSRHKLSRLKKLIIKERADRQLAAAGHALQQATADAELLQQQLAALQMRLEAAEQLQQLLAGSSCSAAPAGDSCSTGPAGDSSACADSSSSGAKVGSMPVCCDPQVAARTTVAALELAVQRATNAWAQAQAEVSKRRTQQLAAQAAWNKAYKVPEEAPEQQQEPAAASQQQSEQDPEGSNSTSSVPATEHGEAADTAAAAETSAAAAAVPELPRWLSQVGSESESQSGDEASDVGSVSCGTSSEEEDDSSSDGEGLSGFVDVLSRWAASIPQQQLAQAFKVARRSEAKAAAAAVSAGPVDPAATLDVKPAATAASSDAAVAAPGAPEAAQQAAAAGASSSSGANSKAGLAAVCPTDTSVGLIDGSESSSGCDSSDDEDAGTLLGWGNPLLPAVANKAQPQLGAAGASAAGSAAAAGAAAGDAAGSTAPAGATQPPVASTTALQQHQQASTTGSAALDAAPNQQQQVHPLPQPLAQQQQQVQGSSCAPLAAAGSQQPAADTSSSCGMTSPTAQITQETPFGPASLAAAAVAVSARAHLSHAAQQQQQQPELPVLRVGSKQQDSQQPSSSHSSRSITVLDPVMPTPLAATHGSSSLNSRSSRGRPLGGPQFERSMSSGRVLDRRHGSNNSSSSTSSCGHAMLQPQREDPAPAMQYNLSWQQHQHQLQLQQHGRQQLCQLPGMSAAGAAGKVCSSGAMHLDHMATSQTYHYGGPGVAHVDSMDSSSSLASAAAAAMAALSAGSPKSTLYGGSSIAGASSLAGGSLFGGSPFGGSPLGGSPLQGSSPSHLALSAAAAGNINCTGAMLGGLSLQQQYDEHHQQQQLLLDASMLSQQQQRYNLMAGQQQQQQEEQDEQMMALQVAATVAAQHSDPTAAAAAAAAAMVSFKQQKQEKQQQELQQQQVLVALEQMSLVCGLNLDSTTSSVLAAALASGEIDAATVQQLLMQLVLQPAVPADLATTSATPAGMAFSSSGLQSVGLPSGGLPSVDLSTNAEGLAPWGPSPAWEVYPQASGPAGPSSTPGDLTLDPDLYNAAAGLVGGPGAGGLGSPHMSRGNSEGPMHYSQQQQQLLQQQQPPPPPPRGLNSGVGAILQKSNSMQGMQQQHQQQQHQQQQLGPYFCGLCQVPCNSLQTLQQHFESKRHITKAAYASLAAVQHSSSMQQQQVHQQQQLHMPLNPAQLQGVGPGQQPHQLSGAMPLSALSNAASSSSGSFLGRSFSPPAGAAGVFLAAEACGDPCAMLGHSQAYSHGLSNAAAGSQAQQDLRRSSSSLIAASRNNSSNMLPYPALTLGVNGGQQLRGRSPTGRSPTAMSPTGSGYGHGAGGSSPLGGSRGASPRAGGSRGASPGGSPRGVTYVGPNAAVQAYCTQEISPELNTAVTSLLTAVKAQQDKAIAKNPGKAALKRYYVCGLREVCKAIKAGKAVAVLLAPNIEQNEAEGGLNDSVQDIITACSAADIPTVFALSRKKMGEVYGFRKRMSAIALLDVACVQETLAEVLQLAAAGRRAWAANNPERLAAAAAAVVASEVAVALGGSGSRAGSFTGALATAAAVPASCH